MRGGSTIDSDTDEKQFAESFNNGVKFAPGVARVRARWK